MPDLVRPEVAPARPAGPAVRRAVVLAAWLAAIGLSAGPAAWADGPLGSLGNLNPFRSAATAGDAAVPRLTERHGPWLIKVEAFAGDHAEEQSTELAKELRTLTGYPTYLHSLEVSHDGTVEGKGFDRSGKPKKMRYQNPATFKEIVVLIGDFTSLEDPRLETTLDQIKRLRPTCINRWAADEVSQRFYGLRYWQDKLNEDAEQKGLGPLRRAFATRNPLLPAEFFGAGGLDPFVVSMNEGAEFSLLRCPKKYTVRIATFRGDAAVSLDASFESFGTTTKLEEAAIKAHELTAALRAGGSEAYEFHDRTQSIVCFGSFDSVGTQRKDGSVEPNPDILRIVKHFGATAQVGPAGIPTLKSQSLKGIAFDVQPLPMEVPRASVGQSLTGR